MRWLFPAMLRWLPPQIQSDPKRLAIYRCRMFPPGVFSREYATLREKASIIFYTHRVYMSVWPGASETHKAANALFDGLRASFPKDQSDIDLDLFEPFASVMRKD